MISDLLQNKVDLSLLVITKALGKKLEEEEDPKKTKKGGEEKKSYANKQVHVELAERMRKRDPATAPWVGDRVAYVIVQGAKGAKAYEKSEDPIYVLNNNLALDYDHYIEHHLKNPLVRLFTPILKDAEWEIFVGDHMWNVYWQKIGDATGGTKGGLMGFVKVASKSCLGCGRPIDKSIKGPVCQNCSENKMK